MKYYHSEIPELSGSFLGQNQVQIECENFENNSHALDIALLSLRIAKRIGISCTAQDAGSRLSYSAPITSATVNKEIIFLNGWSQFDGCIKGFNALGLMAEQVAVALKKLSLLPIAESIALKKQFLLSRSYSGKALFRAAEIEKISEELFLELSDLDLAIWYAFAHKTIVCSTSSNMGISLHQALRMLQQTQVSFGNEKFTLLNQTEGKLLIWCPDERADFMNAEKTALLRSLEAEQPPLTKLCTYINRQQRDPGALRDALACGGYFFPTNPQSIEEIQNLLFVALQNICQADNKSLEDLLNNPEILSCLASLGCMVKNNKLVITRGIEAGIFGLMLPYLLLIEELHSSENVPESLSTWNQASIGAALAAAVLADSILRHPDALTESTRAEFNSQFPAISKFMDTKQFGKDINTQIHGVFDIANLQSLAQLLGVVVENHMTGKGTAFVGLGSSSYSNGNRCYEILKENMQAEATFRGKDSFHPATHTINPFAQALIFGESLAKEIIAGTPTDAIAKKIKKTEPSGAAALAGYLLARLDNKTLSAVELAFSLRLTGFDQNTFLSFSGFSGDQTGLNNFLALASEEGKNMRGFAHHMMVMLGWNLSDLEKRVKEEKRQSNIRYWESPLDDIEFESKLLLTCLYLTGDNTAQPGKDLVQALVKACEKNREQIRSIVAQNNSAARHSNRMAFKPSLLFLVANKFNRFANSAAAGIDKKTKTFMNTIIRRKLGG